jgi:hypothetical protein
MWSGLDRESPSHRREIASNDTVGLPVHAVFTAGECPLLGGLCCKKKRAPCRANAIFSSKISHFTRLSGCYPGEKSPEFATAQATRRTAFAQGRSLARPVAGPARDATDASQRRPGGSPGRSPMRFEGARITHRAHALPCGAPRWPGGPTVPPPQRGNRPVAVEEAPTVSPRAKEQPGPRRFIPVHPFCSRGTNRVTENCRATALRGGYRSARCLRCWRRKSESRARVSTPPDITPASARRRGRSAQQGEPTFGIHPFF